MHLLIRIALALVFVFGQSAPAGAVVYHGTPNLHLTLAVIEAGGGPAHFDSRRLVKTLAGSGAAAEQAKLVKQFSPGRVAAFYDVFTYAVNDAAKTAHSLNIRFPADARPSPSNGRALAIALYRAGVTPAGTFDVGYMLEVLMSHPIHHTIMRHMDAAFTPAINGDFHLILTAAMYDLRRAYAQ